MKKQGFLALTLLGLSQLAMATSDNQYEVTISNHQFEPAELIIPANTKVKLVVHNKDSSPEEFESHSLHREKIIGPNQSGIINIGPLPAGVYEFVGEFHEDTARGRIVVQ
jgi:plastocyanin